MSVQQTMAKVAKAVPELALQKKEIERLVEIYFLKLTPIYRFVDEKMFCEQLKIFLVRRGLYDWRYVATLCSILGLANVYEAMERGRSEEEKRDCLAKAEKHSKIAQQILSLKGTQVNLDLVEAHLVRWQWLLMPIEQNNPQEMADEAFKIWKLLTKLASSLRAPDFERARWAHWNILLVDGLVHRLPIQQFLTSVIPQDYGVFLWVAASDPRQEQVARPVPAHHSRNASRSISPDEGSRELAARPQLGGRSSWRYDVAARLDAIWSKGPREITRLPGTVQPAVAHEHPFDADPPP